MQPSGKYRLANHLLWRVLKGLKKSPRYFPEIINQMDQIGVGSLGIVVLTGFFTGGVLVLQTYPTLEYYGAQSNAGQSCNSYLSPHHSARPHCPVECTTSDEAAS